MGCCEVWRSRVTGGGVCLAAVILVLSAGTLTSAGLPRGNEDRAAGAQREEPGPGRRQERRRPQRRVPMPIECTDFPSALQAWNTFYKRSLVITQRGRRESAESQLAKSREAWYQIIWRYYESPPAEYAEDERWQSDLATITGNLHIAEWLVASGDLHGAHEALEPIRRIWMDVRQRNGIRSFGDELTVYHDVMEPVLLWGTGQTRGGVTEENIDEFHAAAAELLEAWQKVRSFPYRPGAPRGRGGGRQFRVFMGRADEAMEHFALVVAERRIEEIPEASQGLKSGFLSLFIPFG